MKRRTFLVVTFALVTLQGLLFAQADKQAVEQAEKSWAKAVVAADLAALEKIFADDLVYTHSSGVTDTKADYISKLRSGQMKYLSVDYDSMTVKVYGNTATVQSKARIKATSGTNSIDSNLIMLHVWIKNAGSWQLVAHQSTRLP